MRLTPHDSRARRVFIAHVALGALAGCCPAHASGRSTPGGVPSVAVVQGTCNQPAAIQRRELSSADGAASFRGLGGSANLSRSAAIDTSDDGRVIVGYVRRRDVDRDRGALWRSSKTAILPYPDLDGDDTQWVHGVSGDGEVAVGAVTAVQTSSLAAMWRRCELVVLGGFPGSRSAEARSVNADGRVIVGFGLVTGSECAHSSCYGSFLWQDGQMTRLRNEQGAPLVGQAKDVSADGRVIVGWGTERNEAFRIEAGKLRWLGFSPGAADSRAEAVSPDGSVVVGASGEVAFRTSQGKLVPLETLPNLPRSYAYDVSRNGCRIVGNTISPSPPRDQRPRECHDPDRWLADGKRMRELCNEAPTPRASPPEVHAFLWERGRGTRSLREALLTDHGIDVGAWVLDEAFGISADGTTIVGDGKNPEGVQEAWVVRLPPPEDCQP